MLEVYVKLVKKKWRTIESIPPEYQEQVRERLEMDGDGDANE